MQAQTTDNLNQLAVRRARGVAWACVGAQCPGPFPDEVVGAIVVLRGYGNDQERELAAQALGVLNDHRAVTCGLCSPFEATQAPDSPEHTFALQQARTTAYNLLDARQAVDGDQAARATVETLRTLGSEHDRELADDLQLLLDAHDRDGVAS